MSIPSRRHRTTAVLFLGLCMASSGSRGWAQTDSAATPPVRKVVNRVAPSYPDLARKMNLQGSVRVQAVVSPNGAVKTTKIVGGNPVLAQAAERAVQKWRWTPAPQETSEAIEIRFDPK